MSVIQQEGVSWAETLEHLTAELGTLAELKDEFRDAGQADLDVLISGGTTRVRHLLARLIHHEGRRRADPFVVLHTSDVTEIEQLVPDGGTAFVVDIATLNLDTQKELIRILDRRAGRRLDADRSRGVRIIAGGSPELFDRVQTGQFATQLFYRLNPLHLVLPDKAT